MAIALRRSSGTRFLSGVVCAALAATLLPALGAGSAQAVCANVLHVRNNGPNGSGASSADSLQGMVGFAPGIPFSTSPDVNVIYLYIGTATDLLQNSGIFLFPGQKLIGETIGYSDDCNDIPATISAALPAISSSMSAAVILSSNNEVAGVRVLESLAGGILGTFIVGSHIHHNEFDGSPATIVFSSGVHVIEDNEFLDPLDVAFAFQHDGGSLDLTVANNIFTDSDGMKFSSLIPGAFPTQVDVLGNTVTGSTDEAIEFDTMQGDFSVVGNTISQSDFGIDFQEVGGTVLIDHNELDDVDGDDIFLRIQDSIELDLTITSNTIDDSRDPPHLDNFGNGIMIEARDASDLTALVANNHVHDAGRSGISLDARGEASVAARIAQNGIEDVLQLGIRVDASDTAWLRTAIERNNLARIGSSGISAFVTSTTLQQEVSITDNEVDDPVGDGVALTLAGLGAHQLNGRINDNRVFDGLNRGIYVNIDPHTTGEAVMSISSNRLTGNEDEGLLLSVSGQATADAHIEENTFSANIDPYAVDANAGGSALLCSVLQGNEADNDYRLAATGEGIHIYEDVLGSNVGDHILEQIGVDATIGPVGVGTCDAVQIGPLPVPEPEPAPEPKPLALGQAALLCLSVLARGRRPAPAHWRVRASSATERRRRRRSRSPGRLKCLEFRRMLPVDRLPSVVRRWGGPRI